MSAPKGRHLTDEVRTGYVVECRHSFPHARTGELVESRSWWYGPDHGFGTTSGPFDYSVRVFVSRKAAEDALRSVYGTLAEAGRRGYRPVALATARREVTG